MYSVKTLVDVMCDFSDGIMDLNATTEFYNSSDKGLNFLDGWCTADLDFQQISNFATQFPIKSLGFDMHSLWDSTEAVTTHIQSLAKDLRHLEIKNLNEQLWVELPRLKMLKISAHTEEDVIAPFIAKSVPKNIEYSGGRLKASTMNKITAAKINSIDLLDVAIDAEWIDLFHLRYGVREFAHRGLRYYGEKIDEVF